MGRRLAVLLAFAVGAALLSGCVAIRLVTPDQQSIVGDLRLTIAVCKVDNPTINHPGCDLPSNGGEALANTGTAQLLIGFRVPTGVGTPPALSATTNDPAPQALAFARSASYEGELTRLLPAADGFKWIGYLSSAYAFNGGANGTAAREVTVTADLRLPRPADGAPFVGPLVTRPVAGVRDVTAARPAGRSVACGASAFTSTGNTVCVDSPPSAQIGANFNFPTRDFGVVAGSATASPGQTVTLPFAVRGAGALPAGLAVALSAGTELPGVAVAASQASAPIANGSDTRVTVPVAIPKTAGPGVFDVTLTGRLDNGQTRTGTAKLTVRDRQKPVLSKLAVAPKRFRPASKAKPRRGATIKFALSEAASVQVAVARCARRAGQLRRGRCVSFESMAGAISWEGKQGSNSFRFKGRMKGKRLTPGFYRLAASPTDAAGNTGATARRTFSVRR